MSLEQQIHSVIEASGAEMGIFTHHIESGEEIDINGDQPFPLCSVFKIPVLVEAFRQIRDGQLSLDERFELTTAEKNLPSGVLVFFDDGLRPTLRDLLTLMIIISDNTATDMVMHRVGVESTTRTMHNLGFTDIHVPLTVRGIFTEMLPSADPTQDLYELARGPRNLKGVAFSLGPDNDVGTPRALTQLCAQIYRGEIFDRETCDQMLAILLKQQLNERLPRFLPPGTRVAHKTGTLPGLRNDSGIIYARENSHVAVTVFTRWDSVAVADDPEAQWARIVAVDSAIGKIGRLLYDHYQNK